MSDSSTPFGTVSTGAGNQTSKANALFNACSTASIYAKKDATTTGLTLGYHGGKISINGVVTVIADGTIAMTASSTNYVEVNPATGAVSKNTTAYTPGYWRIGRAATVVSSISIWYDDRFPGLIKPTGLLQRAFPSDANYTATQPEAENDIIQISSGVITAMRNFVLPLTPRKWTVYNGNAQSVHFVGATGTGFVLKSGRRATIYSDGTNIGGCTLPMEPVSGDADVSGTTLTTGVKVSALATPAAATGVGSGTGGTLAAATYYTKIVALDSQGNMTPAGTESTGVVTTGSTSSIVFTWAPIPGAASYRIYYGTTAGAEANYYTSTAPTYTLTAASGTAGSMPTQNTTGNLSLVGSGSAMGYGTGAGGAVTQITSRTTGVTLNRATGAITLVSAAGSATWQTFTVTNSVVAATDVIKVCQKSGTDLNMIHVTAVAAGSFNVTFATTGGTTTEQPVFNFAVIKGVAS